MFIASRPCPQRPREACTVGALRASATDVDVTPTSTGRRPATRLTRVSDVLQTASGDRAS